MAGRGRWESKVCGVWEPDTQSLRAGLGSPQGTARRAGCGPWAWCPEPVAENAEPAARGGVTGPVAGGRTGFVLFCPRRGLDAGPRQRKRRVLPPRPGNVRRRGVWRALCGASGCLSPQPRAGAGRLRLLLGPACARAGAGGACAPGESGPRGLGGRLPRRRRGRQAGPRLEEKRPSGFRGVWPEGPERARTSVR